MQAQIQAEGSLGVFRGHAPDLVGGKGGRGVVGVLLGDGPHLHLLEQIEIIVAGGSVCAQADIDSSLEHGVEGGYARCQLEVAHRAGYGIGPPFCQQEAVLRGEPDAVHRRQPRAEKPERVEVLHRAHAFAEKKAVHLHSRLGEVDVDHTVVPVGDLFGF